MIPGTRDDWQFRGVAKQHWQTHYCYIRKRFVTGRFMRIVAFGNLGDSLQFSVTNSSVGKDNSVNETIVP